EGNDVSVIHMENVKVNAHGSDSQPINNAKLTRVGQLREHLLAKGPAPSVVRGPFPQFNQSSNVHVDEELYTSTDQSYKLKCTVILNPATSIDKTSTNIDTQDEHLRRTDENVVMEQHFWLYPIILNTKTELKHAVLVETGIFD
ncbi:hypothetical protein HDU76_004241, partial [Blyttiomyces sp. JEL0837]